MEQPNATTNTLEAQPEAELTPQQVRDLFDIDNILEVRAKQHELYDLEYARNKAEHYSDRLSRLFANHAAESAMEEYIIDNGISFDDVHFGAYRTMLMNNASITSIDDKDWKLNTQRDENGKRLPSGRDMLRNTYESLTGLGYYEPIDVDTDTTQPEDGEEEDTPAVNTPADVDPFIEAHETNLNNLRAKVAELSAKRQGKMAGDGGEEYRAALDLYNSQVIVYGKLTLSDVINDASIEESEKNEKIVEYLVAEQNQLRIESLAKFENTITHTLITRFAELMDHEKRSIRILKSLGLGIGLAATGAVVGAGATVIAGGLGVAAAGAGLVTGTAMLGAKVARAYAQRDAKNRGIQTKLDNIEIEAAAEPRQHDILLARMNGEPDPAPPTGFEELQTRFDRFFEQDIKGEQLKRRRAALGAAAIVAVGLFVGHTLASTVADSDMFGNGGGHSSVSPESHLPGHVDPDAGPQIAEPGTPPLDPEAYGLDPDGGNLDGGDASPEPTPDTGGEFVPDPNFYVSPGEGGIHFFQDMNLTEQNWYDVQHELLDQFGGDGGDFYLMDDGNVGLAHPGQLSEAAQDFIKAKFNMP